MRPGRLALLTWCLLDASLLAHHSTLAFDGARPVTVTGIVTKLNWSHPHTYIVLDVTDSQGTLMQWTVESESPYLLTRLGWTRESVRPGERIRVTGARAKSGAPTLRCRTVELDDGTSLPCFPTYPGQ